MARKNLLSPDVITFYGIILFSSLASFNLLQSYIVKQVKDNMLVFSVFKSKVVCGWVLIATVLSHYWPIVGLILLATMTLVWLTPSDVAEALSLFDNPYVDGDEARIKYNNIKTVFEERMKEHNIRKQKSYQRKNVKNENKK